MVVLMPGHWTNLPEPCDLFAVPGIVTIYRVSLPVININFLHSTKHQLNKDKPTVSLHHEYCRTLNGNLTISDKQISSHVMTKQKQRTWENEQHDCECNGNQGGLSHFIMLPTPENYASQTGQLPWYVQN